MKCACEFKYILDTDERQLTQYLFGLGSDNIPQFKSMALIDKERTMLFMQCAFSYSWGNDYYCTNKKVIENWDKKV